MLLRKTYIDTAIFDYVVQRQELCDGGNWFVFKKQTWFKIFAVEFTYWKEVAGPFFNSMDGSLFVESLNHNNTPRILNL